MKTLVVAIQKGGQGKTFATCHLGFDFHERGLRVLVIDLDPQANASYTLEGHDSGFAASRLFDRDTKALRDWFTGREDDGMALIAADPPLTNLEKMDLREAAARLKAAIAVLGEFFDVCLIDTPPTVCNAMTAAILSADFMLSPIELEAFSLRGVKNMVHIVSNLRKDNPQLSFLGMVPNKVDGRRPRHVANLAALRESYPQLVLPLSIGLRDSFAEALGERLPVWKVRKTAARTASKEARSLAAYIHDKMGIKQ